MPDENPANKPDDAADIADSVPQYQPPAPEPQLCALCGRDYHAEEATEPDEFGLLCPGANADEKARMGYLYRREYKRDEAKMEDTAHWATLNADLALAEHDRSEAIKRGEGRAEITYEQLQADCDTRVDALRKDPTWKGSRYLERVTQDQAAVYARDEELAEGLHIDPPHLTVPGRPPAGAKPKIQIASGPVETAGDIVSAAELKASENISDSALYLDPRTE
jgi:hypothetical protein